MESQAFTVFANKDGFDVLFFASNAVEDRPQTLGGLIEYVVSKGAFPVAWAPEFSSNDRSNPGKRGKETVCAESIAAGRLIEFRDGKYIPLGVAEEAPKTIEQELDALIAETLQQADDIRSANAEKVRPALTWATPKPFDAFGGFFTEPADIADWQDTYFPR